MKNRTQTILACLLFAGAALFAAHLLYSAIAALSGLNFNMSDYGVYTNTVYNLAHGNGFKFLVDHSYLKTHLSFSLALLAPLFWVFRTPMLLIFVQWSFLVGGCMILFRILQKRSVSVLPRALVLFFVCAYPMTQRVMLSEFHGVSAYYLLLPWLLHEILFRRRFAVVPFLFILGLREEAGLMVLPMLLFSAVTLKWRTGYVLSGIAVLYPVLAVSVLYPWINGVSLFAVRAYEASPQAMASAWGREAILLRGEALLWLVLPVIPFLVMCRRRAFVIFLFPLVACAAAMLSGMPRQHALFSHYPAAVMAAMACGIVQALCDSAGRLRYPGVSGVALACVVLAFHGLNGFFLWGRQSRLVYTQLNPQMRPLLHLSKRVSSLGVLGTRYKLSPYFAMREDIRVWRYLDPEIHLPAIVVCDIHELQDPKTACLRALIRQGEYGVVDAELPYLLVERGATNAVAMPETPYFCPAIMRSHGGDLLYESGVGLIRHWKGLARKAPITLAYGVSAPLKPGDYEAVFTLRVQSAGPNPKKGFGVLSIHGKNQSESLVSAEILPGNDPNRYFEQRVPFTVARDAEIEPRVTGGGAELWVRSIVFRPVARP